MQGWRILLWAILVLVAAGFIYLVRDVLPPFIVAFIVTALLEPTVRKLRARGLRRPTAVALVMGGFFTAFIGIGILVTPMLARDTMSMTDRVQEFTTQFARQSENDNFFVRWNPSNPADAGSQFTKQIDVALGRLAPTLDRVGLPSTRRAIMAQYVDKNRPQIAATVQSFSKSAFGIITGMFSKITDVVLIFILAPLMMGEMENFRTRGPAWIPPSIRKGTLALFSELGQVFLKYLRGLTSIVLMYGAAMTLVLWLMGVPSWALLGPLFACLYLVPYIGNIISAITVLGVVGCSGVTGTFIHPFASPWEYGLLVMGVYFIVGAVFDHVIYPQIVGNSVGLSPVVSIFAILCGGALFGLPGLLLAFPLAGSVKVILDHVIRVTSSSQEPLVLPSVPLRHRAG